MKYSKWVVFVLAVLTIAGTVWAVDPAGELVRFKSGTLSFTLLEADGVTPMNGAAIQMQAPEDAAVMAESVSDKQGNADLTLAAGRYLLNVSGRTLSVLEVADDATLTACRVVVPATALMVAGADADAEADAEEEEENRKGAFIWLKPVVIGGVAVLVAAGGYAIYDNNQDDDDNNEPVVPPAPVPPSKPKPKPEPTTPPPPVSAI